MAKEKLITDLVDELNEKIKEKQGELDDYTNKEEEVVTNKVEEL